jgi:hypothetical protein
VVAFNNEESLLAWAAGLFDGEGTIYSANGRVRASVHMTDLDVLETFHSNFGGAIHKCKKQKEHHKESWRWSLQASSEAVNFLKKILPFLHNRRTKRAKEAIEYYNIVEQQQKDKQGKVLELRSKIAKMSKSGMTHKDISILFNVDRSYVTRILNGKYGDVRELVEPGTL